MTADNTDIIQVFYWPGWLFFIKPFFWLLGPTFIGDDRKIVELQREGLKFSPNLMLIQDSDQPAIWYSRIKKAWARIRSKTARNSSILCRNERCAGKADPGPRFRVGAALACPSKRSP